MQTKEKILDAAMKLLEKGGMEFLTIKNICQAAGVSNGTFFHHFKTKDELLYYYLTEISKKFLEEDTENLQNRNIKTKVIRAYNYYISRSENIGLDFISNYYSTKNKAINTRSHFFAVNAEVGTIMTLTRDYIEHAQKEGYVKPELDIQVVAQDICTVVKGVMFDWCVSEGAFDLQPQAAKLIGIYIDSIVTDKYREEFGA